VVQVSAGVLNCSMYSVHIVPFMEKENLNIQNVLFIFHATISCFMFLVLAL